MAELGERARKVLAMLHKEPEDAFLLYAMAQEYRKAQMWDESLACFNRLIGLQPDYAPAYHQSAQVRAQIGDVEGARRTYAQGIEAAIRSHNAHAQAEMRAELEALG